MTPTLILSVKIRSSIIKSRCSRFKDEFMTKEYDNNNNITYRGSRSIKMDRVGRDCESACQKDCAPRTKRKEKGAKMFSRQNLWNFTVLIDASNLTLK
jgi:hypothetical protein